MDLKPSAVLGLAALAIVAGLVVAAVIAQRPAPDTQDVVCPVCGVAHAPEDMHRVTLDVVGYAPDSYPVLVCSDGCAALATSDPDSYRAVVAEVRIRGASRAPPAE